MNAPLICNQRYRILSQNKLEEIHENSLRIMAEVGIVMTEPESVEILKAHGCKVDGSRVYFPRNLVEEAIKSAPSSYTLHGRDESKTIEISCDYTAYAGPYGSPFVHDRINGYRSSTMEDFKNIVKIVDKMENIDIQSHISCEPNDVNKDKRPTAMVMETMRYSGKPLMASIYGYKNSMDTIKLASIPFGGLDAIKDKPVVASIPCTKTPLSYDPAQLGAIRAYAETGQVQLINSLSIMGMTVPVTVAGLVSVQNAEVLAGIVLAQLVNPGCPVVYSASGTSANMGNGTVTIGTPEDAVVSLINGQLANWYKIPCRISGSLSDSRTFDIQSAYESAITIMAAQMAGGNFILHAAGIIDSYNCTSYEKLIVDNEVLGYMRRIAKGVEVDEEHLDFDTIAEVGPEGVYLVEDSTLEFMRDEIYAPTLSYHDSYGNWVAQGSVTAEERATAKWQKILAENTESTLPADVEKDMEKFIESLGV